MVHRGKVRGGVVVLQPGVQLPEEMEVTVEPVPPECPTSSPVSYPGRTPNGVPVFPRVAEAQDSGLDLVNKLRDETP